MEFTEADQAQAWEDWQALTPWERWQTRTKLYEYLAPKLARTQNSLDVSRLTDAEVDALFERALEKITEDEYED